MDLQEENARLKKQLSHAQEWMKKEIKWSSHDSEESIKESIYSFFSPEALSHFPANGVKHIVSAELLFQHVIQWENVDGIWVIISYQKILDEMVELYITKGFRKYLIKKKQHISIENTPLEKSLRMIVEKKYIFSLGRIHQSLKVISSGQSLTPYLYEFSEYLKSRTYLEKSLLRWEFSLQLWRLIDIHVITDKRHTGSVSRKDTITARKIIIWNLEDNNCILQILASSQNVDI